MKYLKLFSEYVLTIRYLLKWTVLVFPVALVTGSLVALFLWLLDLVTHLRWQHEWLLYLLPVGGVAIHFLYKLWGKNSEAGNNLIMNEIHEPGGGVPARMAPLVILTTLVTHLFGGSAGREGTAVQIGGSMAGLLGKWFRLQPKDLRIMLMAGIAAGFGAVFGTPVTGAVFALEVLYRGRIHFDALLPCLMAGVLGDAVCSAWGIHHTQYHIGALPEGSSLLPFLHIDVLLLSKVIIAAIAFGLTAALFARFAHQVKATCNRYITTNKWLIPIVGGGIIILLTLLVGTHDYNGLGVTSENAGGISIVNSFLPNGVSTWSWLLKLIFTAITLGTGFKGGEVTPLFFIGAALGNTLAVYLGAPIDLFAGLGFIAVFAGATNTPLACTIMGVELFGGGNILYFAVACFTAYYFSGRASIYSGQRVAVPKHDFGE